MQWCLYFGQMKTKIKIIISMMLTSTLLVIGLQLYWNLQTFYNYVQVFKSESNASLEKVVQNLMDKKRDGFAMSYRGWMADTSRIVINAIKSKNSKGYVFSIRDKEPSTPLRPPFTIGPMPKILDTGDSSKAKFISAFVRNVLYDDLKSNRINYYTDYLGQSLQNAYRMDTIDLSMATSLYKKELGRKGFMQPFTLFTNPYRFSTFEKDNAKESTIYRTSGYKYGYGTPVSIVASFEKPELALLGKMKWAILSSLALTMIIIYCFAYTINAMVSQKKLTELKEGFVNNMTHELQTPVATIAIAAEAIQDFKVSDHVAGEYLGIIRHQARNLDTLIGQILNSGKKMLSKKNINKEIFSFSELVDDCIRQYGPQLNLFNAQLTVRIQPNCYVKADRTHLRNAITNLLDNAIKYGNVPPTIAISLGSANNMANLEINNDGEGIPAQYQKKIFDAFFRVPTGNIHNIKGFGLGLSYAKEIAHLHNGRLNFESNLASTTFRLTLPQQVYDKS
jgi:two-component system phosphate regulon sensor histidine kinase PhoR